MAPTMPRAVSRRALTLPARALKIIKDYKAFNNLQLRAAVREYFENRVLCELRHGKINTWDVSHVTDMSSLFANYSGGQDPRAFNGDISAWDVSSVTTMADMFMGCTAFNSDISGWKTSSVTSMSRTFGLCSSFNQNVGRWDVSSVTNGGMQYILSGCGSFRQDLRRWKPKSLLYHYNPVGGTLIDAATQLPPWMQKIYGWSPETGCTWPRVPHEQLNP